MYRKINCAINKMLYFFLEEQVYFDQINPDLSMSPAILFDLSFLTPLNKI